MAHRYSQLCVEQTICDTFKEKLVYQSKFSIKCELSIQVDDDEWVTFQFQREISVTNTPLKSGHLLSDTNNNSTTDINQQSHPAINSNDLEIRTGIGKDVVACTEDVKVDVHDYDSLGGAGCARGQHCLLDSSIVLPQGVQRVEDKCDACGRILHRIIITNVKQGVAICGVVISHIQQLPSYFIDGPQLSNSICGVQTHMADVCTQTSVTISPSAVLNVQTIMQSNTHTRDNDDSSPITNPVYSPHNASSEVLDLSLTPKQNIMEQNRVTRTDEPLSGMYDVNGHNIHGRTPHNANQAVTEHMITSPTYMHGSTDDVTRQLLTLHNMVPLNAVSPVGTHNHTGHAMIPPSDISYLGEATHNHIGCGMVLPNAVNPVGTHNHIDISHLGATTYNHIGYGMAIPNAVHNINHNTTTEHHNTQATSITPAVHVIQDNTTQNQSQPGVNSITDANVVSQDTTSENLTQLQIDTPPVHDKTTTGSSDTPTEYGATIPTPVQDITRAYTDTAGSLWVSITSGYVNIASENIN